MEDYIKAGIAFANMYISLAFGIWNQDDENGKIVGTLMASWFTVTFYRFGTTKLFNTGEVNCIPYQLVNFWTLFLYTVLYKTRDALRNPRRKQRWIALWFLAHHSILMNFIIADNDDEYTAKLIWRNRKIGGMSNYQIAQGFIVTYGLLINRYRLQVLTLWTLLFLLAMVSALVPKLGFVRMT